MDIEARKKASEKKYGFVPQLETREINEASEIKYPHCGNCLFRRVGVRAKRFCMNRNLYGKLGNIQPPFEVSDGFGCIFHIHYRDGDV